MLELGCSTTENACINARAARGIDSTIKTYYRILISIIGRDVIRNVIDRSPKVELHLCAYHRDDPDDEPPFHGNYEQLEVVRVPVLKGDSTQ